MPNGIVEAMARAIGVGPSLSVRRQRRPATAAKESEAGPFQPNTEGEAIE